MTLAPLTSTDRRILVLEREWWRYQGRKEETVRVEFDGMSLTRYYQLLNAAIDKPDALVFDPEVVNRLRQLRDERQKRRSAKALGIRL